MSGQSWSIRRRLSSRVLALVALSWLAAIALATVFLDHEINEMLDEELEAVAETTVLYLDASPGRVIPRSIGINAENGERVLRILGAEDPVPETPWPALSADGFHHVAGWRVLRVTAENAVIEVAHNDAWRREEMFEAASAFLLLMLPMIALLLWSLRHSLREGFVPLERLAARIAGRGPADHSPLALAGLPAELKPLASGLNLYIARIDALRQAERQFIANASHELRTPVAALRARLDLSGDAEAREALPLLDSLTRRIERLLQLSRSEAGLGLGRGPADLVQITRLLLREVGLGAKHPIRFDDGDHERMMVEADADALAIMLRNLMENAVEHGTGPVRIRLSDREWTIRNPSDGGFHDTVFAKRPGSPGQGLGLAIIGQLAAAMGVTVEKQHSGGEARITLRFPARGA